MSGAATGPLNEDDLGRWVDAVGEVTIPLFAGFSVTSVIVVSNDATKFRWPGPAILALAIASVLLIAAVQCAYHARLYLPSRAGASPIRRSPGISGENWAKGTRVAYHFGIVALLAGLGLALAPLHDKGIENSLRWSASVIAFGACAGEAVFILARWRTRGRETDGG